MHYLTLYLVKMLACCAVMTIYYCLFLRNKDFHQYNRFYLLSTVVISLLFPLINIPVVLHNSAPSFYIQTLQAITVTNRINGPGLHFFSQPSLLILLCYVLGCIYFFISLIASINRIHTLSRRYPYERLGAVVIYHTTDRNAPFSFMHKIFWNDRIPLESPQGKHIFRHELVHTRELHSLDNLFLQLVLCVAWFNPFFWIIRKELHNIHEFLADRFAAADSNKQDYAEYLVSHAIRKSQALPVAHYFFNSSFKRRIAMILQHSNASRFSQARKFLALPLVGLIFCSLAMQTNNSRPIGTPLQINVSDSADPGVLLKPEVEPQYPGGAVAWQQYLIKTLRYPQSAQELKVQGTVVIQFIVEKNGTIRDVKALSGPEKGGLKEEAIQVVQNSGAWIPAKEHGQIVVAYKRQPIIFRVEN